MTQVVNPKLAVPLLVAMTLAACTFTKRVSYSPILSSAIPEETSACIESCRTMRSSLLTPNTSPEQCMAECPGMVRSEEACPAARAGANMCVEREESSMAKTMGLYLTIAAVVVLASIVGMPEDEDGY